MDISDKVSRTNSFIDSTLETINSKREWIGKQFINFLLLFILLLVTGCLDFATLVFHFEYLLSASYWVTVGAKCIAGVCSFNIGINILWETEKKKDEVLSEAIKEYNILISYLQSDFEGYVIHIFNKNEKKKAYISKINKKIYLLNRFAKDYDTLLYSSELPERQLEKEKNKYCIRRKQLEELKSDEFINKNIDSLKVKYNKVNPAIFKLEIDATTKETGIVTKGDVNLEKAKASVNMVLGMIAISMFITSIGLQADVQEFQDNMQAFWHYCLKFTADFGTIVWQFSKGMRTSRKIVSHSLTLPYVGRNIVLKSYIQWRLETNQPNTLLHEELNKSNKEQVVEMTEEEWNRLKDDKNIEEKEKVS